MRPRARGRVWLYLALAAAALGTGCWKLGSQPEQPYNGPPKEVRVPVTVRPLPGSFDTRLMFDSNSPEVVQQPGILLAAMPAPAGVDPTAFQGRPLEGEIAIFSHHIAKDAVPGQHPLWLGLVASNRWDQPVRLSLHRGASYLSQPDAIFQPLPAITPDPDGTVYAGPGDRVATDMLHGRSPIQPVEAVIPPGGAYLVYSLPIPTNVAIPPPVNGRTTYLEASSSGPIGLAEVAYFGEPGSTQQPSLADYQALLQAGKLAGPRERPASVYKPDAPPAGPFSYGRVAGVARGVRWHGELFSSSSELPETGERIGFPLDATYLNGLGTHQNQAAALVSRYLDTAYAAHGNYGATYELSLQLPNLDEESRTYAFSLSQPLRVEGHDPWQAVYALPPRKPVLFRGPIKLTWTQADGQIQTRYTHVVLHQGEQLPPFATIEVPPRANYDATLTLMYPADSTPPQLLTVERR